MVLNPEDLNVDEQLNPIHILEFDLTCRKPEGSNPCYRVYIDGDLISEKEYIWDNTKELIRERHELRLAEGQHIIEISSVNKEIPVSYFWHDAALDGVAIRLELDGIFHVKQ